MKQPIAGVMRGKGDLAEALWFNKQGVAQRAQRAIGQDFGEMHAMKMHRMGKGRVIRDADAGAFAKA